MSCGAIYAILVLVLILKLISSHLVVPNRHIQFRFIYILATPTWGSSNKQRPCHAMTFHPMLTVVCSPSSSSSLSSLPNALSPSFLSRPVFVAFVGNKTVVVTNSNGAVTNKGD